MKKFFSYFSYIIFSIIFGIIVIVIANNSDILPQKMGKFGEYAQSILYGLGYGIMLFGVFKQKDEWFFYNEYPFKNKLLKFKYFKNKNDDFLRRKQAALKK